MIFYGFTIVGKIENEESVKPCHFNILSSTHCYEEFNDICKHHEVAIEKSETYEIFGWNICRFDSICKMLWHYILLVLKIIVDYDKLLLAICVLLAVNNNIFKFNFDNIYDKVTTIISIFVLASTIIEKIPKLYKRITTIHSSIKVGYSYDVFDDYVKKYHKKIARHKYKKQAHYIYEIMTLCYYLDTVEED